MLTLNATLIGQIVVFLLLLWVIYSWVVPMIATPVNERYQRIADGLAAADAGQKELAEANERAQVIVREARERARAIEDQAQRQLNETVESAKQVAQAEGARIVAAAQAEATAEVGRARDALRREYGRLVVTGASRLIEREIDPAIHARLLDELAQDIVRS
jgi:F-type H+-transporting ATPase subunit b